MTKTDYFSKRNERIQQRLEILLARSNFQSDIKTLRKKWNIPRDGIETEEAHQEWMNWLNQQTDQYVNKNWPQCRTQSQDLIKQGKLLERKDLENEFNKNIPRNAFRYDILHLLSQYKIPSQWEESIRRYLLFNKSIDLPIPLNNVTVQETWDFNLGSWQLSLILSADTTLKDIKAIWPLIKQEQVKLHDYASKKFQPVPNLKRDKQIFDLAEKGMSYEDIASTILKEFRAKSTFGYDDVSKALHRYRKRIGHQ